MRLTRAHRSRLASSGAFTLPVVAVLLTVAVINRAGPLAVSASSLAPGAGPVGGAHGGMAASPAVEAARARIAELAEAELAKSPFFDPAAYRRGPAPVVAPVESGPQVTLQLVMGSRKGNIAMIDGKTYHQGETILETAWTVQTIDIERRSVTLVHADGRESVLAVDRD